MKLQTFSTSGLPQQRWCSCLVPIGKLQAYNPGSWFEAQGGKVYAGNLVGENMTTVHVFAEYGTVRHIEVDMAGARPWLGLGDWVHDPIEVSIAGEADGEHHAIAFDWVGADLDPIRSVHHSKQRLGESMFATEAYLYQWSDHPISTLEFQLICSNPEHPALESWISNLEIGVADNCLIIPRWRKLREVQNSARSSVGLIEHDSFGDGQAQAYVFDIVDLDRIDVRDYPSIVNMVHGPAYVIYDYWQGSWGPLGAVPFPAGEGRYGKDSQSTFAGWAARKYKGGSRWDAPRLGLAKTPAQTGDQQDFGFTGLSELHLAPDGVAHLDEALYSAFQEACRPNKYLDADGNRLRFPVEGLHFWGDMKHWHPGVSPNRLGKELPDGEQTHGWWGRDWEHCSANHLVGTYALTGSWMLRGYLEDFANAYLFGCTTLDGWSITDRGAARSVGRRFQAIAWIIWLLGGDTAKKLSQRVMDRITSSYQDVLNAETEVTPLYIHGNDLRWFKGEHRFWMPWQEAQAIMGLYMIWKVVKDQRLLTIIDKIGRSWIQHGWYESSDVWDTFSAIRWKEDGSPLKGAEIHDDDFAVFADGTDFDLWSWPAAAIVERVLAQVGDPLMERAAQVCRYLRDRRQKDAMEQPGFLNSDRWALEIL